MDAQNLLMKRLATASHDKIYPSITPKCEVQLRRTLLTTRLDCLPLPPITLISLFMPLFSLYLSLFFLCVYRLWNRVCRQQHLDNERDISDADWTWFTQTIQADDNGDDKSCDWLDHEDDGSDSPRKRSKSSLCTPAVLLRV
jgi:hypothetical protein